jgi:hypothetical protein
MKVLVKGPYSVYSGYGQDGFGMIRALSKWGCDVYPQPTNLDVPIPRDLLPLFAKSLEPPFDLTINHWSPDQLGIRPEARELTRCAVAWTMWEFAPCPPGPPVEVADRRTGARHLEKPKNSGLIPHCPGRGSLRRRLSLFDLVLGYDEVTMDSLGPYIPQTRAGKKEPVAQGILQGGYESADWEVSRDRDWHNGDFTYLMHGALNARKQAWTTIQAFVELKHEKGEAFEASRLALHSTLPGLFPELNEIYRSQKITVYIEAWDHQTVQAFYNAGHVLLSPSRGEGKNLPALEFLTTGGTVAVTDWGGHRNWLNEAYAYPLAYRLTPTWPDRPDAAHDAIVSVEEVKRVMWHTFTHRGEARRKGELGARTIPAMCDWSVVTESLFRRIRDLVPYNGSLIYDMAMRCRKDPDEEAHRALSAVGSGGM